MQRSSSSRVAAFPSTQADIAGPAPATRRRQSRKQSLLSLSECADDLQPVVMETHSVPPYRIGSKRRSKSDSAVFSVGSDIALTPKGRIKRALKGQKVHKCHCGKIYTRNEHLRRHQATHGEASTICDHPGCKKEFYRDDLYCRHRRAHEQPDDTSPILPLEQSIPLPITRPSGADPQQLGTIHPQPLPDFDGLDLLADTAAIYGVPDTTVNDSTGFPGLHHYSSLPEVDPSDLLDANLWAGPATSYPWVPLDNPIDTGFIDPALTIESTDASSSEYSYGSVIHPSPAPRHATYPSSSFEYPQSMPPTPAPMLIQTDWNRDNLFRLLTLGDPDSSGAPSSMHTTSRPGWYSAPMTTGPQSACMSRTDSAAVVAGNNLMQQDILEDFPPFMENTLGPGGSGHYETGQPQVGPRWR